MMIKKYYYTFNDIEDTTGLSFAVFACDPLNNVVPGVYPQLPFTLTDLYVEGLWERIVARYHEECVLCIKKDCHESAPNNDEVNNAFSMWIDRFLSFVAQSYEYYFLILEAYADAQGTLMDDIKATSKNKVKFNDTPQNANTGDTYEGDNYITHFTKTEGETSSPLMTPIMRLKEIQDHVKRTWADWVEEAEKLFIEESNL